MKCLDCQTELLSSSPACPVCGAPRPSFCIECGAPLPVGAKFCPGCGTRVQELTTPRGEAAGGGTEILEAEPPLPPDLRDKIESVRAELTGERREVAVLFADVSGFTALSERLDPEEVGLLIHRLLRELSGAVYRYEGFVDKYIGDAVMALFGAPLAHENDPERAVLAALAMLETIERHNATAQSPLALRVGINLGEVVAVHLGSAMRLQYTVIGDVVNVAARLQDAAAPNTILVSEALFQRVAERFQAEKLPTITVKGRTEPLQTYRILRFDRRAPLARPLAPFVGREAELGTVESFLAAVVRGAGGILLVEAEPGTGKSRLAREGLGRSAAEILTVELAFSAIELPGQPPPLAEIFHQLLPEEPAGKSAVERALSLLGQEAESHQAGIEGLAREADPSLTPDSLADLDPAVARQNRWVALAALLRAAAENRPVVLLIEDIHWMDEATREFTDFLSSAISGRRIGILLTSRPRAQDAWVPAGADRLVLPPLEPWAAEALVGEFLEDMQPEERREILRRSEGNPLFLEELARELRQRAQAGQPVASVPGTLQGLLVSRIDRLSPPVRLLLEMASVLGTRFPTRLLARMYRLEPQPVGFEDALRTLQEEAFLESEVNGDIRHHFHHALVQEVAYARLLLRIRKVLHESAARLGEEYYAERLEAEAPFFAHHYWEAGLPTAATPHLWTAGRAAAELYDLPSAERFLERAAQALQAHPDVLGTDEQRASFYETFGHVLLHRSKLDAAEVWFRALEELGASGRQSIWEARGLAQRARVAWYRGRLDEVRSLCERGLAHLPADEGPLAADLHNLLGLAFFYRGAAEEAFIQHRRALRLREELSDELGLAKSLSNIGNLLLHFRDDLAGAQEHYLRALELARGVGDRREMSLATNNLGYVAMERGEWERALTLFGNATRIEEEMGWSFLVYVTLLNRVLCEISLGRIADALQHLKRCVERGDAFLEPVNRVNTRFYLFEAYLRALADAQAERALRDARELALELEVTEQEDELRLREARWLAARGMWGEAADAFAGAEEAARGLNHPPLERLARAHRCRAESRAGTGATELCPPEPGERAPLAALMRYLNADAEAEREPSPNVARALADVGRAAAGLGEICLERAAFEREAEVWRKLGNRRAETEAIGRAAAAFQALERRLPEELRPPFATHPRNAACAAELGRASVSAADSA